MKFKLSIFLLIILLALPLFLVCNSVTTLASAQSTPSLYVGVDVAFESVPLTEQLIDNMSSYTNVFIVGCVGGYNETRLTVLCQYAYDKGMSFIVFTDTPLYPSTQWFQIAQSTWGSRLLGVYYYDEPGGRQLDQSGYPTVLSAANYTDAANKFVSTENRVLYGPHSIVNNFASPTQYPLFCSDYAFYWYDYEAGYNTVFAEFVWNYSRQLNIALCRGAATVQNKNWGVMIDWTYNDPPYIESGSQLYSDMVLAYNNGAKYIIIFDSDATYIENILGPSQLNAMQQFWQYAQQHPRNTSPVSDKVAYVLPDDYAYGFRGPDDRIWGLWGPDADTNTICMNAAALLQAYGTNLDIVYPSTSPPIDSVGYQYTVNWNDTALVSQLVSNTASPSPSTTASAQTEQPTSTPSSNPQQGGYLLGVNFIAIITGSALAVVAVAAAIVKVKKKNALSPMRVFFK